MAGHLGVRLMATACVVGLTLACFGPGLSDSRQLAYRDYSEFYYPLYQKVQQEWDAGRLPLWAAEENGGSPMLGNPTSAVLYPGKLIYAALPYPRAAKAYVVAHVLLAFAAMLALLARSGVSAAGATLGGMAYAFGAPVLTQYSNVVFLVGAAWMPLGFLFADGWTRLGRPRALAGLALVLAMQVLGGDPEAAYLTAFAAAAYAVGRAVVGEPAGRRGRIALATLGLVLAYLSLLGLELGRLPIPKNPLADSRPWWRISPPTASLGSWVVFGVVVVARWVGNRSRAGLAGSLLGLLGACLLAAALAGAQLAPTLEFLAQSNRSEESPLNNNDTHSIHPARVVEWAWPNAFGQPIWRNRSWLNALPPTEDHRIWMSSIYLGGLTTVLAAGGIWARGPSPIRAWMAGMALVGVLTGFGTFASPLFWARAVSGTEANLGTIELPEPTLPRPDGRLRDGDGGPYWFLASTLPGFRSFRYPGKLFIPAALGIAGLAGIGFDGLVAGRRRVASTLAVVVLGGGLAGLVFVTLRPRPLLAFLKGRAEMARSMAGPFDPEGAAVDLRLALVHGSAVMAAFLVLAGIAPRRPKAAGLLALAIMAVDLGLANRGEVAVIAQAAYKADSDVLAAIRRSERDHPGGGPFRVFRLSGGTPGHWQVSASPDRPEQIIRWWRETLMPKSEQPLRVASTFAYGTVELGDYEPFFNPIMLRPSPEVIKQLGLPEGRRLIYFPRRGFDLWNTRYFILPNRMSLTSRARGFASFLFKTEPVYPAPFAGPTAKADRERWSMEQDVQVVRNLAAYPRAWVVHRAIPVKSTKAEIPLLMSTLLYQDDGHWHLEGREVADPRRVAWVEEPESKLAGLAGAVDGDEPVEVTLGDDPTRVELTVTLKSPGLVVLADVFYPGWQLEVDGRAAEILRVNRMMRGAVVPAGSHRLVYTYRPISLAVGVGMSAVGLLGWLGLLAVGRATMPIQAPRPGDIPPPGR